MHASSSDRVKLLSRLIISIFGRNVEFFWHKADRKTYKQILMITDYRAVFLIKYNCIFRSILPHNVYCIRYLYHYGMAQEKYTKCFLRGNFRSEKSLLPSPVSCFLCEKNDSLILTMRWWWSCHRKMVKSEVALFSIVPCLVLSCRQFKKWSSWIINYTNVRFARRM